MKRKLHRSLFLLFLIAFLPFGQALAVECAKDVAAAKENLTLSRKKVAQIPEDKRKRVEAFLDDGQKMMEKAQRYCQMADSSWEIMNAKGMALVAQANISAAHLLIKEALLSE